VIVLVRHGETDANRAGLLLGRADPPLNERGQEQAAAVAGSLASHSGSDSALITSPLLRARDTAARISDAVGVPAAVDERLIELDYGDWDERRVADVPAEVAARWRADPAFAPPGGESLVELRGRVAPFAAEVFDHADERTTILVSHVSPIKAIILWGLDLGDEYAWRLRLDVAAISRMGVGPTGPMLLTFNETTHLR
jgi:broad specificity phosphatase PhoE